MIFNYRLRVFRTVAEKLSFTQAARELFVSQPAVTKHINELEKQIEQPLFIRRGNSISLTRAGKVLLNYAGQIEDLYQELNEDLRSLQEQVSGQLRIGASTTIAQYILPPILATLKEKHPQISFSLINGNSKRIRQLLINDKADIGLTEGNTTSPELHEESFIKDEIVLVTTSKNSSFQLSQIDKETLTQIPLIIRESGSGTLDVIEQAFKRASIKRNDLQIEMRLGSTESIKKYLLHSNAFALLSIHTITEELATNQLRIIEIKSLPIYRELKFISLHGQHARLVQIFKSHCLKQYNQK